MPFAPHAHRFLTILCLAVTACGSGSSDGPRTAAGASTAAGAASMAAPAAISGGSGGTPRAGAGGSTSSNCSPKDPGTNGIPAAPEGQIRACFGTACPRGMCSTNLSNQPQCEGTYPVLPHADFAFCEPHATGAYCLSTPQGEPVLGVVFENTWFVRCEDGAATVKLCPCRCGGVIDEPATCG